MILIVFLGPASTHEDAFPAIPGQGEPSWSGVYGYAPNARANPLGTATLIGNKETVRGSVLFNADTIQGIGDGLVRTHDDTGSRVHWGHLEENK
ncbi:MAG: hypothetical protein ACE5GK_07635 [Nitrospiria bacterium]